MFEEYLLILSIIIIVYLMLNKNMLKTWRWPRATTKAREDDGTVLSIEVLISKQAKYHKYQIGSFKREIYVQAHVIGQEESGRLIRLDVDDEDMKQGMFPVTVPLSVEVKDEKYAPLIDKQAVQAYHDMLKGFLDNEGKG